MRERPEDYCVTAGELHGLLGQLYDLCAVADGQQADFEWAQNWILTKYSLSHRKELLTENESMNRIAAGDSITAKVISFWTAFDAWLGFPTPAE